jgi:hypothetical protein
MRTMTVTANEFIRRFLLHVLPKGIRPHPPLGRDGQLPTFGIDGFVHEAISRGPADPLSRRQPAKRNLAVPSMSQSHDPYRKAYSRSTLLTFLIEGFRGFFLVVWPSEIFDVLRHVNSLLLRVTRDPNREVLRRKSAQSDQFVRSTFDWVVCSEPLGGLPRTRNKLWVFNPNHYETRDLPGMCGL